VEECSFNTISITFDGHRIYASRKVAEKIEVQTRYAAELYNVDARQDQRYLAEKDQRNVISWTQPTQLPKQPKQATKI
jgi:hypothetical protein